MRFDHVLSVKVCKSCDQKLAITLYDIFTSESHSFDFLMCLIAWALSLHCVWHMAASPRLSVKCRTLWSVKRVPQHCDYDGFADRRESCSHLSAPVVPPHSPAAAGKLFPRRACLRRTVSHLSVSYARLRSPPRLLDTPSAPKASHMSLPPLSLLWSPSVSSAHKCRMLSLKNSKRSDTQTFFSLQTYRLPPPHCVF